ncbi:hypothetical protein DPMN_024741 [Dreissena polymorpha]|uniref:Uncharacterized protein n=1 Tax=Dreissena polymorpha TaxID=45954 RepID=A0A9D4LRY2_DREPO|nr:hypothetical protein DPMN_024741 [Dreissena polymorpha]
MDRRGKPRHDISSSGLQPADAYPHAACLTQGRPRVGNGAMHINRCRNEEVIVKGNFGWTLNGAMHKVQYQLEVNGCRYEEIIVKGNFGWVWPMWAGRPRIDRIVIRAVQYQFEVNRCENEEINFQGSSANSVRGNMGQDGRTDRWTDRQWR